MSFTMLYQLLIYEFSVSIDWFVSARRIQRQSSEKKKGFPPCPRNIGKHFNSARARCP